MRRRAPFPPLILYFAPVHAPFQAFFKHPVEPNPHTSAGALHKNGCATFISMYLFAVWFNTPLLAAG
jgi:hypothetical protein